MQRFSFSSRCCWSGTSGRLAGASSCCWGRPLWASWPNWSTTLMLVFGLMLPFLVTDLVAHDFQQRMHELVMTCACRLDLRWGRYLAALLVSLGLALISAAQFMVNAALHLTDAGYPAASLATTLTFWALLVIPPDHPGRQPVFRPGHPVAALTVIVKLAFVSPGLSWRSITTPATWAGAPTGTRAGPA